MAYVGSTAASSVSNPPVKIAGGLAGGILGSTLSGMSVWLYSSSDLSSVMSTANYFTDAFYLGMRTGDIVMGGHGTTPGSTSGYMYIARIVEAVTTNGGNLSTAAMQVSSQ